VNSLDRLHWCGVIALGIGFLALVPHVGAGEPFPIVAGFERFGRSEEGHSPHAGQLLLTELNCTACHSSPDPLLTPKLAANLDGIGSRTNAEWLMSFLMAPHQAKPGTTMPDPLATLDDNARREAATALVSYLSSLRQDFSELKASGANPVLHEFYNRGDAQRGRTLFHTIGCIACHEPSSEYEVVGHAPSDLDRLLEVLEPQEIVARGLASIALPYASIPLANLHAKYSNQSLTYFLLQPELHNPRNRMPNFGLSAVEAADLTSWLRERDSSNPVTQTGVDWVQATKDRTQVERGRKLFVEFQCAQCHQIGKNLNAAQGAKSLKNLSWSSPSSCIAADHRTTGNRKPQPWYPLDDRQREALRSAVVSQVARPKELEIRLLQWNCYACHERQSVGGVGQTRKSYLETVNQVDLGDEGRLPPSLTHVGSKLTREGMTKILEGTAKVRPHMTVRMPRFVGHQYQNLATWLAAEDKSLGNDPFAPLIANRNRSDLVEAGRKLMDIGCVQCHAFRGEALPGVVGIDLEGVAQRVQSKWFQEFLVEPSRWKPRTRMPSFFPDGKSQVSDILDGNVSLQIAAMHLYLSEMGKQPLPDKLELARSQTFELKPTDRPIIIRTFLQDVGLHAIAVGLPEGVHYAWDGENACLGAAWRGRFLDAQGTWVDRFAPLTAPLGRDKQVFPKGPVFTSSFDQRKLWPTGIDEAGIRFLGYRLDEQGSPTFRLRVADCEIEETITAESNGLRRVVRITMAQDATTSKRTIWTRLHAAKQLKPSNDPSNNTGRVSMVDSSGLRITSIDRDKGLVRHSQGMMEWLVPLPVTKGESLVWEVVYQW
jgi:mono/diheme cytochrome c family protein